MSDRNLIKLTRRNLLAAASAAVGSKMFAHLYVKKVDTGEEIDVTEQGRLSCAYFVSSLLTLAQLLDRPHAVVASVVQAMKDGEWEEISSPRAGAVVVWPVSADGHEHIGIATSSEECVSHTFAGRTVEKHSFTLTDGRTPTAFYWHADLDDPEV